MTPIFRTHYFYSAFLAFQIIFCSAPLQAQEGPALLSKPLYANEINYRGADAPNGTSRSLLFDDLGVKVLPHGDAPPIAIKSVPLRIGVIRTEGGVKLGVDARGASNCADGAKCLLILWVNGRTTVMDLSNDRPGNFFRHTDFTLPAADGYQARIILIAEREAKRHELEPSIVIDSIDMTIAAPPAA